MSSPTAFSSSEYFRELLDAARTGDRDAQGRLLEAFRRPLLRMVRKQMSARVQAKGGASDVVQDALVKALHDIRAFRGCTPEQLDAWLRAIVTHTLMNFANQFTTDRRQIAREAPRASGLAATAVRRAAPAVSETVVRSEEVCRIREAIARLPARQAEVVRLHHEERLSYLEIGVRIGRTAEAARKMWVRAVAELARALT